MMSAEQRKQKEQDPGARKPHGLTENDVKISEVLEQIARTKSTTLQAVVCPTVGPEALLSVADSHFNRL